MSELDQVKADFAELQEAVRQLRVTVSALIEVAKGKNIDLEPALHTAEPHIK